HRNLPRFEVSAPYPRVRFEERGSAPRTLRKRNDATIAVRDRPTAIERVLLPPESDTAGRRIDGLVFNARAPRRLRRGARGTPQAWVVALTGVSFAEREDRHPGRRVSRCEDDLRRAGERYDDALRLAGIEPGWAEVTVDLDQHVFDLWFAVGREGCVHHQGAAAVDAVACAGRPTDDVGRPPRSGRDQSRGRSGAGQEVIERPATARPVAVEVAVALDDQPISGSRLIQDEAGEAGPAILGRP